MVQFNFSERTIKAKVVYYGPAQSGKTTNLEQVHIITDPAATNRLVSLNTAQDRTLFFDLLPFSLGTVSGYDFQVQLYTVPGQVQYNATRRVVLAGADAVVFVADSRKSMAKENLAAFENMKVNLLANRLVPEKVPLVLQWNKRDLADIQTEAEMAKALNPWGRPAIPAAAFKGEGVLDTFMTVVQQMLQAIAVKYNLKEKGLDPAAVPELVAAAFAALMRQAQAQAAAAPPPPAGQAAPTMAEQVRAGKVVLAQAPDPMQGAPLQAGSDTSLVAEELLHRSIKSNVELAESLSTVVKEVNMGLNAIISHAELMRVYRDDAREKRQAAINNIHMEATRLRKMLQDMGHGGVVAPPPRPSTTARPGTIKPGSFSAPGPASHPPAPTAPPPPPPPPAPPAPGLEAAIHEALAQVQTALDARSFSVDVRVPPGLALPKGPPPTISKAVAALLRGVSTASAPGSATMLRAEKKPVLLRGKNGEEMKRDFMMLALSHGPTISPEDQQRVLKGGDPGPLGEAWRLVRDMGGFVRFAPLPGGGLETRLFLPAA